MVPATNTKLVHWNLPPWWFGLSISSISRCWTSGRWNPKIGNTFTTKKLGMWNRNFRNRITKNSNDFAIYVLLFFRKHANGFEDRDKEVIKISSILSGWPSGKLSLWLLNCTYHECHNLYQESTRFPGEAGSQLNTSLKPGTKDFSFLSKL